MDVSGLRDEAELQGLMFSIAYRMTGSVSESEELVQEAFFRLARARQSAVVVESPRAFLAAATTRLSIDYLRSARARRESYVGSWLPEPVVADLHETPEPMAELSDSLSMAFLVMLEALSPVERAVFLLREVFDYPYEDIAKIVEKSEANCRQVLARARQHLQNHHTRYKSSIEQTEALLQSFLGAARDGDLDQLVDLLAADAVLYGDGGGKATSVPEPIYGRDKVAAFIVAVIAQYPRLGLTPAPVLVNGGPGFIAHDAEGKIVGVLSLEVHDGVVEAVRSITNPDKLEHLGPTSDVLRI